jgi:hypothetical protein
LLDAKDKNQRDRALAATARVRGFVLVTRNIADFRGCGVQVLDPFAKNPVVQTVLLTAREVETYGDTISCRRRHQLETSPLRPYDRIMENLPDNAPPGWLETLEESEAELAAGLTVPAETVHRELRESIARLEAKAATKQREAVRRR